MNAMIHTLRLNPAKTALPDLKAAAQKITDASVAALPPAFLGLSALLESGYAGYNRVADTVSELVWGPNGWVETCLFVLAGVILPLLGWRLFSILTGRKTRRAAWAAAAAMGLAFIVIAIFPTTAPDSTPDTVSTIHEHMAQFIALLFPCACALTARGLRGARCYTNMYACSLIAAGLGLVLNVFGLIAMVQDTEWLGAIERAIMMNGFIWLGVTGYSLWRSDCGHSAQSKRASRWLALPPTHTTCAVRARHNR